jgi:Ulp1 family protease
VNYFSKPNEHSPEKLTVAIYKYFKVGKDKQLYIPLHLKGNHFILVIILFDNLTIEVYDPMDNQYKEELDHMLSSLNFFFETELPWNIIYMQNIPRQSDCFSCAFFTCWYAYMHAMNGHIPMFSDNLTIRTYQRE